MGKGGGMWPPSDLQRVCLGFPCWFVPLSPFRGEHVGAGSLACSRRQGMVPAPVQLNSTQRHVLVATWKSCVPAAATSYCVLGHRVMSPERGFAPSIRAMIMASPRGIHDGHFNPGGIIQKASVPQLSLAGIRLAWSPCRSPALLSRSAHR